MGQSYLKNAALLTGSDVVLRLAGMGLRIWLANALGGAGMGLYQLVLAVYALFVTLATAGVSVAATRLMAEELARGRAQARGMLVRLAGTGLLLGAAAGLAAARHTNARLEQTLEKYAGQTVALTAEVESVSASYYPGIVDAVLRVERVNGRAAEFRVECDTLPVCEAGERVESTPHAMEKYTMPTPELPPMSLLRRKTV